MCLSVCLDICDLSRRPSRPGKRWGDALTRLRGFPLKALKSPTLGLRSKGDVARSLGVSDSKVSFRRCLDAPRHCKDFAMAFSATLTPPRYRTPAWRRCFFLQNRREHEQGASAITSCLLRGRGLAEKLGAAYELALRAARFLFLFLPS